MEKLQFQKGVSPQYVDDLWALFDKHYRLLNHLASCGYKVLAPKLRFCKQVIKFLGFLLGPSNQSLIGDHKDTIIQVQPPEDQEAVERIWENAGCCHIWTHTETQYEALMGPEETWTWIRNVKDFWGLKGPALGLLNLLKPFHLYVHERKGTGRGVLRF